MEEVIKLVLVSIGAMYILGLILIGIFWAYDIYFANNKKKKRKK